MVKYLSADLETQVSSLSQEDTLEKGLATHSSILAWGIPWTEEPGGLRGQKVSDMTEGLTHPFSWLNNFMGKRIYTKTALSLSQYFTKK